MTGAGAGPWERFLDCGLRLLSSCVHRIFYRSVASLESRASQAESDTFLFSDLKILGSIFQTQSRVPMDDHTSPTSLTSKKKAKKTPESSHEKGVLLSIIRSKTGCCTRSHIYITAFSP